MNSKRYLPVGNDVYLDHDGPRWYRPGPWLRPLIEYVGLALTALVLYLGLRFTLADGRRAGCERNLKGIANCLLQYAQDYDNKLPPAPNNQASTSVASGYTYDFGWADAILPYALNMPLYWCPESVRNFTPQTDPTRPGFTFYWFNGQLAGHSSDHWPHSSRLLLTGDGEAGNARYTLAKWPTTWRTDSTKPPFLHQNGANYAFADGHVKWLLPDQLKTHTSFIRY